MEKIDILTATLLGSSSIVSLLCALVLYRGGLIAYGQGYIKPTRIQKMFAHTLIMSTVLGFVALYNIYLTDEPSIIANNTIDALCMLCFSIIPLQALSLQQIEVRIRHWAIVLCPYMPLIVVAITMSETHPSAYTITDKVTYVYLIVTIVYSLYRLKRWDAKLLNIYSDVVHKQTIWFQNLILPNMIILVLWIPLGIYPEQKWIMLVYYALLIIIYVRTTAYALVQEEFTLDAEVGDDNTISHNTSDVSTPNETDKMPLWAPKLERLMTEEHVYRQEDLTLADLAAKLNINRSYLSRHINNDLRTTFYDYINTYRLEESEKLLKEGKMTISEIATHCGFRDRAAFYRIFRKKHGVAPMRYIE